MVNARIKIKVGNFEIEYEGDEAFINTGLMETLNKVANFQKFQPALNEIFFPPAVQNNIGDPTPKNLSVDTIANLLKVGSATDLIIASAAHLQLIKGQVTFSRQEIIDEMRRAPGHFKQSYINNLSSSLSTLKKDDRIRLVSGTDIYSLSNTEKLSLESKLANS